MRCEAVHVCVCDLRPAVGVLVDTVTGIEGFSCAYLVVGLDVEFDLFPGERAYSVTTRLVSLLVVVS
jgi:hypothetical protein